MLNPEFKQDWLAALRSGEYEQGKAFLSNNGRFCCLGVAKEICSIEKASDGIELLNVGAAEALGLPYYVQCDLSGMNDSGRTFAEIADYIEGNL